MARYIDLDKAIERLKASPAFPNLGTDGCFFLDIVVGLLERQPSIKVNVIDAMPPKVTVVKSPADYTYGFVDGRIEGYERARAEVAREIFAVIEDIFEEDKFYSGIYYDGYEGAIMTRDHIYGKFAALKKKYIGEQNDEN